MSAKIKPWGENILVKCEPVGERTYGKIVLSEKISEHTTNGVIEAIGAKCETALKVGDRIFFSAFNGAHIDMKTYGIADDSYRVIREDEIQGIIIEE
jgi:co-chaperonin GroES (HSP10)